MNSGKAILIAGGTGLIGQALVKHLLKHGYEVNILTRNVERARILFPEIVSIHKWPKGKKKILFSNNKSYEAVINLSGENIGAKRWTKTNKAEILNSRINSITVLYELIQRMPNKPKVWVQASATGYYGFNTLTPVDEFAGVGQGFLALVVNAWEKTFHDCTIKDTKKVVLRFGVVMASQGGFLNQMQRAFNWGLAVCPGSGNQYLSWIHIDDLVEIIYQSVVNPNYTGIINAVTPNPISLWEFTGVLKKHTNALLKLRLPAFVFRLLLGKQKADELVLANQQIKPTVLVANKFQYKFADFNQIFENR
jgi:uncharacterized protein (TIGR01777 family)